MNRDIYVDLRTSSGKGILRVESEQTRFALKDLFFITMFLTLVLSFVSVFGFTLAGLINGEKYMVYKESISVALVISIGCAFLMYKHDKENIEEHIKSCEERTETMKSYLLNTKNESEEAKAVFNVIKMLQDNKIINTDNGYECLVSKKDFKKFIKKELKRMKKEKKNKSKDAKKLSKDRKKLVKTLLKEK